MAYKEKSKKVQMEENGYSKEQTKKFRIPSVLVAIAAIILVLLIICAVLSIVSVLLPFVIVFAVIGGIIYMLVKLFK